MTQATLEATHLQRLRADYPTYAGTNLLIKTKPGPGQPSKLAPFDPNWAQRLVHSKAEAQLAATGRIRILVLKARQLGISTYVAGRIYQGCTLWSHRRGLVLADEVDRAAEIFSIYERFEANAVLSPPRASAQKRRELSWTTDSRLTVETARDVDTGRGSTLDYVHASEFASYPYPEDVLAGLLDAMPADAGEFWIESTAKGVGNAFHEMWLAAVAGESEWMPIFLPWFLDPGYQLPLDDEQEAELIATADAWEREAMETGLPFEGELVKLTPSQLAWRRRKIREKGDPRIFRQENPSTPEEAFLVSGSPYFDEEAVADMFRHAVAPARRGSFVQIGGGLVLRPSERGFVRLWEEPDPHGHYVIGVDTAEGRLSTGRDASLSDAQNERGGRDFSSADVLKVSELVDHPTKAGAKVRVPCLRQVAQVHDRIPPELLAEQVFGAGAMWSCPGMEAEHGRTLAFTGVERNHSSGQTTIRELRERHKHTQLFLHRRVNTRTGKPTTEFGWVTDGTTRMPMLDELAAAVREGRIRIYSADTLRELSTFVRGDDGRPAAQEGAHDDRVISLAIALQMARFHHDGPSAEAARQPEPDVADTPTGM